MSIFVICIVSFQYCVFRETLSKLLLLFMAFQCHTCKAYTYIRYVHSPMQVPFKNNDLLPSPGGCDEAFAGRGIRRRGQPHLLQAQHGNVAGRCQEDLRRTAGQSARVPAEPVKQSARNLVTLSKKKNKTKNIPPNKSKNSKKH